MDLVIQNIFNVSEQVLILFALMLIGLVCGKCKLFTEKGIKELTLFLIRIVTVAIIVDSFLAVENSPEKIKEMLLMVAACVIATSIGFILSAIAFAKTDKQKKGVLQFATVFSNCGFMSIPLADALFGSECVFYVSIYMCCFQIFIWTLGILIIDREHGKISLGKIIINPGIIGIVIGLFLFIAKIKLPTILSSTVVYVSDLNTPLAMIITGFYLKDLKLKFTKDDLLISASCLIRLIIVPALTFAVLYPLGFRGILLLGAMIPSAAPAASNTTLFAVTFTGRGELASRTVSISTILSMITLPVVIALVQTFSA